MKKIAVIGSFNIDMFMTAEHFPVTGESARCDTFDIFVGGGKGANQAVAAAKLQGDVSMFGMIGTEFYGLKYLDVMQQYGVNCNFVQKVRDERPGVAFVAVDAAGDNMIYVYPGANRLVDRRYIDSVWNELQKCDIFLFQLEIPLDTVLYAMKKLSCPGKIIILDPAPAEVLPEEIYPLCDLITPNEVELSQITGLKTTSPDEILKAAEVLLNKGTKTIIAKAGKNGAYIISENGCTHVPPIKVNAVDPTAAGDSFNAGLAYSLSLGKSIKESAEYAGVVAGISTTKIGAQSAMPTKEEVACF